MDNCLYKKAKVVSVQGDLLKISFQKNSACASCEATCAAKDSIMNHESSELILEFPRKGREHLQAGDEVKLGLKVQNGLMAVYWAYIVPLLLILLVLVCPWPERSETTNGFAALGGTALYYTIWWLWGKKHPPQSYHIFMD